MKKTITKKEIIRLREEDIDLLMSTSASEEELLIVSALMAGMAIKQETVTKYGLSEAARVRI